jgi:hypothetical protein
MSGPRPKMAAPGGPRGGGVLPGGMGGFAQEDPYGYFLEPTYRKLRYEIGCAMRGLRGSEEFRKSASPTSGVYTSTQSAEEKQYIDDLAAELTKIASKLKVTDKTKLDTEDFKTRFRASTLQLDQMVKSVIKGPAAPKRATPPAGKAPPALPDEEIPDPAAEAAAAPRGRGPAVAAGP